MQRVKGRDSHFSCHNQLGVYHWKDHLLSFLHILHTHTLVTGLPRSGNCSHVHGGHASSTASAHDPSCSNQGVHLTLIVLWHLSPLWCFLATTSVRLSWASRELPGITRRSTDPLYLYKDAPLRVADPGPTAWRRGVSRKADVLACVRVHLCGSLN